MDTTEVRQREGGAPTDAELGAWDWRATLKREERSYPWLARRTERSVSAVQQYATGRLVPPVSWLRSAAIALDWAPE